MTTFGFSTTIPAANNDPADDQPLMLNNNASTASLIAVDHVGFNTPSGGYHKQVTFSANQAAPGVASGVSDLFANLVSGQSQLFFQNATTISQMTGLTVQGTGGNFGVTTPWGLIINFGNGVTTGNTKAITFAVPMTTLYAVAMTPYAASGNTTIVATSPIGTGFTATASGSGTFFGYIAIGI